MLARKKKATFYLPEDLLRVARVHAARTDRRDSQVVEEALRAYLGYGTDADPWVVEPAAPPEEPAPVVPEPPPENAAAEAPPPPLAPDDALALAIGELHALRDERAGGR
jgi:hypothetical protein